MRIPHYQQVSVNSPQTQLAPTNSSHIYANSLQPTRPILYQLAPHLYQLAPPISLQLQITI